MQFGGHDAKCHGPRRHHHLLKTYAWRGAPGSLVLRTQHNNHSEPVSRGSREKNWRWTTHKSVGQRGIASRIKNWSLHPVGSSSAGRGPNAIETRTKRTTPGELVNSAHEPGGNSPPGIALYKNKK